MSSAKAFIDWAKEHGVRPLAMWEQARFQHLLQNVPGEVITREMIERLYLTLVLEQIGLGEELPTPADPVMDEDDRWEERRDDDFIERLHEEDMIASREEREAEYAARAKVEGAE